VKAPLDQGRSRAASKESPIFFYMILVWIVLEHARPSNPMMIPFICSVFLLMGWLSARNKRWNQQTICLLLSWLLMVVGIPFATNWPTALDRSTGLFFTIVTTAVPMTHYLSTVRRVEIFSRVMVGVFLYMGLWAVTHEGYGPAGGGGAQDQNYVATYMSMMIPFAYFGMLRAKGLGVRLLSAAIAVVFVAATVIGNSRGGFLALLGAVFFCWLRSPRKWIGFAVLTVACVVLFLVAGETYWTEMATIADTDEGTADGRLDIWGIAFRMFLDHPIMGVGPGNFVWSAGDYQGEELILKYNKILTLNIVTHSLYFELLAELGSVGVALFSTMLWWSFRNLMRQEREVGRELVLLTRTKSIPKAMSRATGEELRTAQYLNRSFLAGFVGFLIGSVFISTYYLSALWVLFASIGALVETTDGALDRATALRSAGEEGSFGQPEGVPPALTAESTKTTTSVDQPGPSASLSDLLDR